MTELTRRIDHRDRKRTTVGTLYTFIIHTSYIKCHTMYYIVRGAGLVIARNYLLSTNKLLNPSRRVRYARATIQRARVGLENNP